MKPLRILGKIADIILELAAAALFVWFMCNAKELVELIMSE